jgi:serine/threonine protein kinase
VLQEEIPRDDRIGRRLANGRFEVTEWSGPDFLMGVAVGRDDQGRSVRLTFAGDVSRSADDLRSLLTRDVPGLAPVLYVGATDADDRWAPTSIMAAELLPLGEQLDLVAHSGREKFNGLGARLVDHVARIHRNGSTLGTLRPESTFVTAAGDIELVTRGERLWLMPRPNMTRPAMMSPWSPGYLAPEYITKPLLDDPDPAADVFSLGVMLATSLLGRFVYAAEYAMSLLSAQLTGDHLPLPATPLGEVLARCLKPDPAARPSLDELAHAVRATAA